MNRTSFEIRVCRLCKERDQVKRLVKASERHYIHPLCGLKDVGTDFLNSLREWQLRAFPVLILSDFLKGIGVQEKATDMLHRKIEEARKTEADVRKYENV